MTYIKYLYDDGILYGFILKDNNHDDKIYYYIKDKYEKIYGIMDSNSKYIGLYSYNAYGIIDSNNTGIIGGISITVGNNILTINKIRYKSYYFDDETEMYYLKNRYYNPLTGLFLTPDNPLYIDFNNPNSYNLFRYCYNNPVMYSDVDGTFAISSFLIGLALSSLVGWGLSQAFGSQIAGGIGSCINGAGAVYTGTGLLSFGPVGWIAGGALIIIGAGTIAFGVNDIVTGVSGTNYIQSWTGMSDSVYFGINLSLNIASTVGTIAGNIYMKYNPRYPGNNPNKIPDGFNDRKNLNTNYYNPKTRQSLHPDLNHSKPIGPHWDWKDSNGVWWRLYRFWRIKK